MTKDELLKELEVAKAELSDTLRRTRHLYFDIDFGWIGYLDENGKLQLLTGVVSLSLDENIAEIQGRSGQMVFGFRRLPDTQQDALDWLWLIADGRYKVPEMGHVSMHFTPNGTYSNIGHNGDFDEVTVTTAWTSANIPGVDWRKLENDLRNGKAAKQGSLLSLDHLWKALGIEDPQHQRGLRARIPRRGSLEAMRNADGALVLEVTLPVKADLRDAQLQIYKGQPLGETLSLQAHQKVIAGQNCIITVPWTVGPSGKDTVQLFFADKLLAKCDIFDIKPQAHAYLVLDGDAAKLKEGLFPTLPIDPKRTDVGPIFEASCGTLLALLGFGITPVGRLGLQGDWIAEYVADGNRVEFLVESSAAPKDRSKLKELVAVATHLSDARKTTVMPVVFTAVSRGSELAFDSGAASQLVRVLYRADLKSLLDLALDTTSESRTREAFFRITGMMV